MSSLSEELLRRAGELVQQHAAPTTLGKVARVAGLLVEATVPDVTLGDLIEIECADGHVPCEVVGFKDDRVLAIPLGETRGLAPGANVRARPGASDILVGDSMIGRAVDAFGHPIDGGPPLHCTDRVPVNASAPPVSARARVTDRFDTGVRVIDGLLTCGRGQRVGIFAGAGVGKSVLVEQIASQSFADVTVIGLIGERGREVRELMSAENRGSTIVVAATSDKSPMERARGARTATAVAEYFRDRGRNVLLVIDSVTRYAMALREIGLSIGEPPATKGYPPSVFAALPRLLERVAPMANGGSITAFYAVLVEGDDLSDPVADSARSLLDAHIVLSRDMAGRGQFPAVDVLASASRVARQVTAKEAQQLMVFVRQVLSVRRSVEELQSLGAYVPGRNQEHDAAMALGDKLDEWCMQPPTERSDYNATMESLRNCLVLEGMNSE